MRVLVIGIDGYLGWPLVQYLTSRGHEVAGIDYYFRRKQVEEVGSQSAIEICSPEERINAFNEKYSKDLKWVEGDITNWDTVLALFKEFQPESIVHLGENPSAPYSMIDQAHATWIHQNNVISN